MTRNIDNIFAETHTIFRIKMFSLLKTQTATEFIKFRTGISNVMYPSLCSLQKIHWYATIKF